MHAAADTRGPVEAATAATGGSTPTNPRGKDVTESVPADRIDVLEDGAEGGILRAKYLDYCSAQLADLLLYLSPDEIYLLAEKARRSQAGEVGPGSYIEMMQTATAWLSTRVSLPKFEDWVRDYQANPDHYERYLMGLWESELEPTNGT